MAHIPICEVVRHEDHWFNVQDENGETLSDLVVDDLDHLTSIDFYYLDLDDPKKVIWYSNSVSYPDVESYRDLEKIGKDASPLVYFFHEPSKKFKSWDAAYCDMADHIAFSHFVHVEENIHRLIGICGFRLICDAPFTEMVRRYVDYYRDDDNNFGKIIQKPIINLSQF